MCKVDFGFEWWLGFGVAEGWVWVVRRVDMLEINDILNTRTFYNHQPNTVMLMMLKHDDNLIIWLRVFAEVMSKDPSLKLDENTMINHGGADASCYPEVHVLGVFKIYPPHYDYYLVIVFIIDASWDSISDVKFEVAREIDDLKLPSSEEIALIRFYNVPYHETEQGDRLDDD